MTWMQAKNNAFSTLASTQLIGDDHLHVATGGGALFPSTFPFPVTIGNEIELCTGRTTDTLTTTRAQEGTSAAEHASGSSVQLRVTAAIITELQTAVDLKMATANVLLSISGEHIF